MTGLEILTTAEMAEADRLALTAGVASLALMENAGKAVAVEAAKMAPAGARIAVLCGPGNNGGDGFVAARYLAARGFDIHLTLSGAREALKGDAAEMAARWTGSAGSLGKASVQDAGLVVDALFGAGLSRPIEGDEAVAVEAVNAAGIPVLAVDVPSGLDGDSGLALGPVIAARRTVTFFRRKPAHLLFPGRALCGAVTVADIGIAGSVLQIINPLTYANSPLLWLHAFPWARGDGHKYGRGHAVVVSGPPDSTGAARLGARGALRMGAGLVTLASPRAAVAANASHLTAVMLQGFDDAQGLADLLKDTRKNAVLHGPGRGTGAQTLMEIRAVLQSGAAIVLDADAITSIAGDDTESWWQLMRSRQAPVVLTPHEGEFRRIAGPMEGISKLERARHMATASGAVVVLKGPDTVIAAPGGRAAINENAPPWLATAGSGDVLAGFIVGLLAQGMPAFEASCAAVWLHGAAADTVGPGLISEDLPEALQEVLRDLHAVRRDLSG